MNKVVIGKKIKQLRQIKGLTQAKLAEIVDMHEKHISRIESGKICPTFDNLINIFNALDYNITQFLNENSSQNISPENPLKSRILKIINNANQKELIFYTSILEQLQKNLKKLN